MKPFIIERCFGPVDLAGDLVHHSGREDDKTKELGYEAPKQNGESALSSTMKKPEKNRCEKFVGILGEILGQIFSLTAGLLSFAMCVFNMYNLVFRTFNIMYCRLFDLGCDPGTNDIAHPSYSKIMRIIKTLTGWKYGMTTFSIHLCWGLTCVGMALFNFINSYQKAKSIFSFWWKLALNPFLASKDICIFWLKLKDNIKNMFNKQRLSHSIWEPIFEILFLPTIIPCGVVISGFFRDAVTGLLGANNTVASISFFLGLALAGFPMASANKLLLGTSIRELFQEGCYFFEGIYSLFKRILNIPRCLIWGMNAEPGFKRIHQMDGEELNRMRYWQTRRILARANRDSELNVRFSHPCELDVTGNEKDSELLAKTQPRKGFWGDFHLWCKNLLNLIFTAFFGYVVVKGAQHFNPIAVYTMDRELATYKLDSIPIIKSIVNLIGFFAHMLFINLWFPSIRNYIIQPLVRFISLIFQKISSFFCKSDSNELHQNDPWTGRDLVVAMGWIAGIVVGFTSFAWIEPAGETEAARDYDFIIQGICAIASNIAVIASGWDLTRLLGGNFLLKLVAKLTCSKPKTIAPTTHSTLNWRLNQAPDSTKNKISLMRDTEVEASMRALREHSVFKSTPKTDEEEGLMGKKTQDYDTVEDCKV